MGAVLPYVCLCIICMQLPWKPEEAIIASETGGNNCLLASVLMLGTELRRSVRAASSLNSTLPLPLHLLLLPLPLSLSLPLLYTVLCPSLSWWPEPWWCGMWGGRRAEANSDLRNMASCPRTPQQDRILCVLNKEP